MHFNLVDHVVEVSPTRIVTLKHVSSAEEYLQDHFPTFPVLPGVMMLEAMVQAARRLAKEAGSQDRLVLGQVRALKYGAFVAPGSTLRVEIDLHKQLDGGQWEFKGQGLLIDPARGPGDTPTAVSGRFLLRPVKVRMVAAAST
ncbi:MAG TPA: FabA/FabZ family ACP-dehydratase [Phycisphaerales bacterium]|nr:FabA/FabZ family ACP-dehydratase [Phycisphaerales bacterium]